MVGFNLLNIIVDEYSRHEVTLYEATNSTIDTSDEFLKRGVSLIQSQLGDSRGGIINYNKELSVNYFDYLTELNMSNSVVLTHDLLLIDMRLFSCVKGVTHISFRTKNGNIGNIKVPPSRENFIVINIKTKKYRSMKPIKLEWYEKTNSDN